MSLGLNNAAFLGKRVQEVEPCSPPLQRIQVTLTSGRPATLGTVEDSALCTSISSVMDTMGKGSAEDAASRFIRREH